MTASKAPEQALEAAEQALREARARRDAVIGARSKQEHQQRIRDAGPTAVWASNVPRSSPEVLAAAADAWAAFRSAVGAGDWPAVRDAYVGLMEARVRADYAAHRRWLAQASLFKLGFVQYAAPAPRYPFHGAESQGFAAALDAAFAELVPAGRAELDRLTAEEMEREGLTW